MCSIYNILNAIYLEHNKPITKKKKKSVLMTGNDGRVVKVAQKALKSQAQIPLGAWYCNGPSAII